MHFFDISSSKSGLSMVCFVILNSKRVSRHNGVHFFDGTFEEDLQRYISVAGAVQETCSSEMLGQIFRFAEMILR